MQRWRGRWRGGEVEGWRGREVDRWRGGGVPAARGHGVLAPCRRLARRGSCVGTHPVDKDMKRRASPPLAPRPRPPTSAGCGVCERDVGCERASLYVSVYVRVDWCVSSRASRGFVIVIKSSRRDRRRADPGYALTGVSRPPAGGARAPGPGRPPAPVCGDFFRACPRFFDQSPPPLRENR